MISFFPDRAWGNLPASRKRTCEQYNSKFHCRSRGTFAALYELRFTHEIRGRQWALGLCMIIHLRRREAPFVQIDKACLNDPRLSFKAKGLLAYLLTKPETWVTQINDLQKASGDGEHAIQTAFGELEAAGYAKLITRQGPSGQWCGKEWVVSEVPFSLPPAEEAKTAPSDRRGSFPTVGFSDRRKSAPCKTDNDQKSNNDLKTHNEAVCGKATPASCQEVYQLWKELSGSQLNYAVQERRIFDFVQAGYTLDDLRTVMEFVKAFNATHEFRKSVSFDGIIGSLERFDSLLGEARAGTSSRSKRPIDRELARVIAACK
jgi:hypothetical protein